MPGEWRELEIEFANSIEKKGALKTYENFLAEQSRLLRQNYFPFVGKKSALEFLKVDSANLKTKILGGAAVTDMAYAYGEYEATKSNKKTEKGFFFRIWTRDNKNWRIALDMARSLPTAQE
jgi:hypothetical protein